MSRIEAEFLVRAHDDMPGARTICLQNSRRCLVLRVRLDDGRRFWTVYYWRSVQKPSDDLKRLAIKRLFVRVREAIERTNGAARSAA